MQPPELQVASEAYDHGSDPAFVAYYADASQTPKTHQRFTTIQDRAFGLLAESLGHPGPYDVVDVGCGAGTQSMLWAQRGHRVRGLDVNRALIELARHRAGDAGLQVQFDVGTATALPYESASADVVLSPELLEHVVDWERCLSEAARLVRPGGLLYLSTTSWLCPVQQEFTLPAYSWYPPPVKHWCEKRAVTTHPQWANHARYPAVHWFSYYGLSRWLAARGFRTLDRFDVLARQPLSPAKRLAVAAMRALPPLRLLGHMATEGSLVWAIRERR